MSSVWNYFSKNDTENKVKCNQTNCIKEYVFLKNQGTSNLRNHLKNKHKINIENTENEKKNKIEISDEVKNNIDDGIAELIIKDDIQLRIVESKNLQKIFDLFGTTYKLPNRKQINNDISRTYDVNLEKIKFIISNNKSRFSISADIWTAISKDSYLGIKLHFIDNDFILRTYTIGFINFNESHTGENMSKIISDTLTNFNIINVQSFTSDHASNNLACVRLLKEKYQNMNFIGCFAHLLNIILQSGLLKNNVLIEKVRKIIKTINKSSTLLKNINDLAVSKKLPFYSLKFDVSTRWNSTFFMLESLVNNETLICALSETNTFSAVEWNDIKNIVLLLRPFNNLTNLISGVLYPTIAYCYSLSLEIKKIINNFSTNAHTKKHMKEMLAKYETYTKSFNDCYYISMILDPRFKCALLDLNDKQKYIDKLKTIYKSYKPQTNNIIITNSKHFSPFPINNTESNEIDSYLSNPLSDGKCDILLYWKLNSSSFPILSNMAKDFLAMPATSVSCEQMFSKAGDIITKKRNNISPTIIEKIMCCDSWLT